MDIQCIASSSHGNCYRVTDGTTALLLECGIPLPEIQKAIEFKLSDIAGVLVTHEHGDHSKAVNSLLERGKAIYMSKGTASALKIESNRVSVVESGKQFVVGTWAIMPFQAEHDAAEPLGYLLASRETGEKLLFATDTFYIRYRFNGLTHIMIECNHSKEIADRNVENGSLTTAQRQRLFKSHFSLDNVKEFLKANDLDKVQAIYLLHLSDGNSDAEQFKQEIQALTGKLVIVADA